MKLMIGGALAAAVAALGVVDGVVADDGSYCREYTQRVTIGGVLRESYGTACMQPDGSWKRMDAQTSDQDMVSNYVTEDLQVAQASYVQPQVQYVYEEPVYYSERYYSRPYYPVYGPTFGVSLGFNDHHGGGHRGGGHGEHRGGHGRH